MKLQPRPIIQHHLVNRNKMKIYSRTIVQHHLVSRNKMNVQPRPIVQHHLVSRNKMKIQPKTIVQYHIDRFNRDYLIGLYFFSLSLANEYVGTIRISQSNCSIYIKSNYFEISYQFHIVHHFTIVNAKHNFILYKFILSTMLFYTCLCWAQCYFIHVYVEHNSILYMF